MAAEGGTKAAPEGPPTVDGDAGDESSPFTYEELWGRRASRSLRDLPAVTRSSVRLLWRAARTETLGVTLLQVLSGLLAAAQLVAGRELLTRVVGGDEVTVARVLPWGVVVVCVLTVSALVNVIRSELQRVLGECVAREAQNDVAAAASSAELVEFDRPEFHNRLQRVLANSTIRPVQVTGALVGMVGAVVAATAVALTLVAIEPLLLVVSVVAAVPLWLATRATTRLNVEFEVSQTEPNRQREYLLYLLSERNAAKELRAYELAPYFRARHRDLWSQRIGLLRSLARRRVMVGVGSRLANGAVMLAALVSLVFLVERGRISVADAGVAVGAVVLLSQRAGALVGGIGGLLESTGFLREVDAFLAGGRRREETDRRRRRFEPAADGMLEVRAEGVSFRYPSGVRDAVDGVDVVVRTGEVVALVGANGSGKTTLAKLMAGLYAPQRGSLSWNGVPVGELDRSIRAHAAYVFQDFERFMFTAGENIGFGRWERLGEGAAVAEAARRAGAADLIEALPAGYSSLLGPQFLGGSDLSVGQWQRVALARAFFRDAALVVLDEPSSALDPEAEADLFARLRELCAGKAVVVISHRFSTVASADRIYVMEAGRVVEGGTHRDLLDAGGRYATLFNLQAQAYRD